QRRRVHRHSQPAVRHSVRNRGARPRPRAVGDGPVAGTAPGILAARDGTCRSAAEARARLAAMSMQRFDIVVAGGGMVGAACALALAREGFSVALVERHAPRPLQPGDPAELRVVALSLASERLLRRLGAWEYMESVRTSPYTDMHVWDADFEGVHFDAAEIGESFLGHIVENRLVQHALWQRFQEADNATCLCPAAIAQATPQDDGI